MGRRNVNASVFSRSSVHPTMRGALGEAQCRSSGRATPSHLRGSAEYVSLICIPAHSISFVVPSFSYGAL